MADPICRWRNSSIKQLMEFNSLFPFGQKLKTEGRSYVEKLWSIIGGEDFFTTPYQLAAQMGVYYEDNTFLYPRFNKLISIEEAASYMLNWGKNYYSPNPYTKSIKNVKPVVINKFLVNYAQTIQNPKFSNALKEMFGDNVIGNTDILKNMLNTFSEVNIDKEDIVSIKYNVLEKLYNDEEIYPSVDVNDKKAFFEHFGKIESIKSLLFRSSIPLQQIYYGAPGTGKSHTINEQTEGESVIRTTFHPDSDYSTFVGAYKPTMGLLPICDELGQPMKIGSTVLHKEQIIYEFVDQAFLQAYVNAWKYYAENSDTAKKQYLVIEEINRGNCAQIFGDLFQLLDRNDYGFSVYPINADKDMKKHLEKAFKGVRIDNADSINQHYKGRNVVKEVLDGDILLLPNNLYIWATMNTSDQSLFPIDSAFKRRWEWQYMPIGKGYDENGQEIKWAIEGATQKYDWWSFLEKINAQVGEATQSEDKKLGFFFCKATDGVISAEKFVGKVIFYLWNDVFKNNGFDGTIFQDADKTELSFGKFYKSDIKGNAIVQKDKVELFLNNLGVEVVGSTDPEDEDENEQNDDSKKSQHVYLKSVTFDDEVFSSDELSKFEVYIKSLQKIGLDRVVPIIEQSKYKRMNCPLVSKQQYDAIIQSKPYSYVEIDGYQFVKGAADETLINVLNEIKEALNLSFSIETYKK